MASFVKYYDFTEQIGLETHNLNTDVLKVALFNTTHTPAQSDTAYSALANEVASGNGYTTGGEDATAVWSDAGSGVGTLTGTDIVWTAAGGTIPNVRYAVFYNDTAAGKNLIGYWDYGSGVTLAIGETFTVDFGATILTVT